MSFFRSLNRSAATGTVVAAALGLAGIGTALSPLLAPLAAPPGARAQGTPGLVAFRWDNSRDYRRLYFFMTETQRLKRSEYYLILKPKDRNTAILKLSVGIPKSFDVDIDPKNVQLCYMKEGGMLARTRCEKVIPGQHGRRDLPRDTGARGQNHRRVHESVQPVQRGDVSVQCVGPGPRRCADLGLSGQLADPD